MIPVDRAHLHVAAATHPGMSGKNNEDRFAVSAFRTEAGIPAVFAIVSDGIGGHRAGEVAAAIAVEEISQSIAAADVAQPVETLVKAVVGASQAISVRSRQQPDLAGMGATCACAWIIGDRLYTATVGDSRIYLLHGGDIRQISIDHTWVQEAVQNGLITPDQARSHPNAHVIRRYLGSPQTVVPDTRLRLAPDESDDQSQDNQGLQLSPGDQILLSSDGLTDLVEADEIAASLVVGDLEKAVHSLVNLANHRGGHDNITIVSLAVPQPVAQSARVRQVPRRSPLWWGCAGTGVVLLLAAFILAGAFVIWGLPAGNPTADQAGSNPSRTVQSAMLTASPPPAAATLPAVTPPSDQPQATHTPKAVSSIMPKGLPTALAVTLTPWPTNTLAGPYP